MGLDGDRSGSLAGADHECRRRAVRPDQEPTTQGCCMSSLRCFCHCEVLYTVQVAGGDSICYISAGMVSIGSVLGNKIQILAQGSRILKHRQCHQWSCSIEPEPRDYFQCRTMTSDDGDISALLSEPSLPEKLSEASGPDDFLPAILESIKSNEKEVELSPEEAAWADSCFVQTSELSDVDWGAMRKALLDSLEKPVEDPHDTTEVMHDKGTHVISELEERHARHAKEDTRNGDVDMEQRGDSHDDDQDATEVHEAANVIRGTDGHGKQADRYTAAKPDDGDELVSSEAAGQAESRDSIFKVWDLGTSLSHHDDDDDDDEIELTKDLKRLLRDNPQGQEATYPPPADTAKALSEINIDELVSGLGDLSLQQTSEPRPSNGDTVAAGNQ